MDCCTLVTYLYLTKMCSRMSPTLCLLKSIPLCKNVSHNTLCPYNATDKVTQVE
jgi:hypothetical protein